jgi:hypothetical protein
MISVAVFSIRQNDRSGVAYGCRLSAHHECFFHKQNQQNKMKHQAPETDDGDMRWPERKMTDPRAVYGWKPTITDALELFLAEFDFCLSTAETLPKERIEAFLKPIMGGELTVEEVDTFMELFKNRVHEDGVTVDDEGGIIGVGEPHYIRDFCWCQYDSEYDVFRRNADLPSVVGVPNHSWNEDTWIDYYGQLFEAKLETRVNIWLGKICCTEEEFKAIFFV